MSSFLMDYEYPGGSKKRYVLQEHLSKYLNVKALHRKFHNLSRRNVSFEEKIYLLDHQVIDEMEANFRLIALKYRQVLKFMKENFIEKYHSYIAEVKQREIWDISRCQREFNLNNEAKFEEFYKKALIDTTRYNAKLNLERISSRSFSMDIQRLVLHRPRSPPIPSITYTKELDPFPVALVPWQYQTNYVKFTEEDLSIIRTSIKTSTDNVNNYKNPGKVIKPRGRRGRKQKFQVQVIEKESIAVEESPEIPEEPKSNSTVVEQKPDDNDPLCAECGISNQIFDKYILKCSKCDKQYHAVCMDISARIIPRIRQYDWVCYHCKACVVCGTSQFSSKMLLCDACDRAYHSDCVNLNEIPLGRWVCEKCGVCSSCLKRKPSGTGWILERQSNDENSSLVQVHCARCSRKYNKGLYCSVCLEAHWEDRKFKLCTLCANCRFYTHPECLQEGTEMCLICSGAREKRL